MGAPKGIKRSAAVRKRMSEARRKWWAENGESAQKNRAWLAAYASDRMTRLWAEARENNSLPPNAPSPFSTDPESGISTDNWYDV